MTNFIRFTMGLLVAIFGLLILYSSVNMSYQGYEREYENFFGAGFIGVGVAGLAFLCAGAVRIAAQEGMKDVACIAAVMAVICFAGDVYGNSLATAGDVQADRHASLTASAAWNEASETLTVTREAIRTAQSELGVVTGSDILAAQRLLTAKGFYSGKLDGIAGGQTERAMRQFAVKLRADLETLTATEKAASVTVSTAAPEMPSETDALFAWIIAFALTALSMASSAIGLPLMFGKPKSEQLEQLEAWEEQADAVEAEITSLHDYLRSA